MRASVLPTSVLPTPASPSSRSGLRMPSARKIAVASPRSGRYDSAASACSTSSTEPNRTQPSYCRASLLRRIVAPKGLDQGGPMYPPRFDYMVAESVEDALSALGDDVKPLAGGQSLIPLMKLRFAAPAKLVDIGRLDGLDALAEDDG